MKTNETSIKIENLRTSNASDYVTNGEIYQVFPSKIKISQINLPVGIEYSKREKVFYSIGYQYLALNEDIKENLLYDYLQSINKAPHLNVPLSSQSITKIVSIIFNKRDKEGQLKLIENKERTIIFSDNCNLTKKQKIEIVNKEKGLLKQEKTKQTIYQAIEGWTGSTKITTAGIAESTGLSLRTVKTYWSEFKDYVSDLNKDLKMNKKDNTVQEPSIEENVSEIKDNVVIETQDEIRFDKPRNLFDYYELIKIDEGLISVNKFNVRGLIEDYRQYKITLKDLIIEANKLK